MAGLQNLSFSPKIALGWKKSAWQNGRKF